MTEKEQIIDVNKIEFWCPICEGTHLIGHCQFEGKCLFCKKREATLHFGDMLSFTHGGGWNCCELCSTEMQLAHARERAAVIPELEAKVSEIRASEEKTDA